MKLATENLVFQGLNEGDIVDFREVKTIEELNEIIVENYVILCRKCASESFCKFHDTSEPPCPILVNIISNYINMNIKSIDTENQYSLAEFLKSVILLIQIFNKFENWRGIYVDDGFNWYFESVHPRLNLTFAHNLLVEISKFVSVYNVVQTDRLKKFIIFVEGSSEFEALPPIFEALGVVGINFNIKNSVKFINLEGKDSIQRDKIKLNLKKYREEEVSYFLIIDNDQNVGVYIDDLKREGLLEDGYYLIWDETFEDNFSEETILEVLNEEDEIFNQIDIDELKQDNSKKEEIAKSIEYLLRKKGIECTFDDYKVKIAQRLSELICRDINESMTSNSGVYDGTRTPTSERFPDFVEKLRKMAEKMKNISSEYHVIKS